MLSTPPNALCHLTACTAERFFRVDRAQEHLHYLMDIAAEQLFILEEVAEVAEASTEEVSRSTSQEASQDASQEVLSPSDEHSSERATPDLVDDPKDTAKPAPAPAPVPAPAPAASSYTPVYSSDGVPVASPSYDSAGSR